MEVDLGHIELNPCENWFKQSHIDELVQEKRNSIANGLELRLSFTNQ